MTDSGYPGQLDDDVVLPRVDDNITEIGGEAINGLRSAVFAIEACLGINPQGTAADLATRLDKSLTPDGSIKASALEAVGLVTWPIVDFQVADNAGILEAKLDLDYPTVDLKTWIDSLWVFVNALSDHLNQDIFNLSQHVTHPSAYGRHRTSDIDGYDGYYATYNLQGIVTDLYNRITGHIADAVGAHAASAISFDDQGMDFVATEVQTAIEQLNELHMMAIRTHQDNLHSNGILKTQETFYGETNHSYAIVGPLAVASVIAGTNYVVFSSLPTTLAQVRRDDRVEVTVGSKIYGFQIESANPATGVVSIWGTLPVSGTASATVYRTTEELSEPSVLALTIRQESLSGNPSGSIIQMVHPGSPYIISSGLDLRKLSASYANVKFGWSGGSTAVLNIYTAMQNYPGVATPPSAWTVENLAIVLNNLFRQLSPAYRYPLVAFAYRGEIGIAFDEPSGYIEALACTNSAWTALGLTGTEKAYSLGPRRFYLDGYEFSSVRLIADAYGETLGINDITSIDENLPALGVTAPGLMRVSSSVPADDGTYAFNTVLTNVLSSDGYAFAAGGTVNVRIYGDAFGVDTITYRTLFELFVDGYANSSVELRGAERLTYQNGSTPAGDPESWFDIVDVSRTFSACERRINIKSNIATFGERGTGKTVSNAGPAVVLPTPSTANDAIGFRFRLYDGYGVDYIELEVASGSYIGAAEDSVEVDIFDRPSEEHHIEVGIVLHNTSKFKHLSDRRLFGTVGRKDVREDYTRDYVTYPTSLLRGNGVIYGMGVRASSVGTSTVNTDGGQVLVNGIIYTVASQNLRLPADGAIKAYNLFVDDTGAVKLLEDNGLNSGIPTPSAYEIAMSSDKVLIAHIISTSGNLVDVVDDLRRFVNTLDNKIELVVDEGGVLGSFATLFAAADYLTLLGALAITRIIRVKGAITHDISIGLLTLPEGTILEGDSSGQENYSAGSVINLVNNGLSSNTVFMAPSNNCVIRNLTVTMTSGLNISDIMANTSAEGIVIEKCMFDNVNTSGANVNIFSANYVTNFKLRDSTVIFADASANCAVLNLVGIVTASTEVEIDGCRFHFSSLTGFNEVAQFIGAGGFGIAPPLPWDRYTYPEKPVAYGCHITNCTVHFPEVTSGTSAIILGGWLNDSIIRGCAITASSQKTTNLGTYVLNMERTTIVECLFRNIGLGITVGPIILPALLCTANTIKDNVFLDVWQPIGLLNVQDSTIGGNMVYNTTATAAMVYLGRDGLLPPDFNNAMPTRVDVVDNIFISQATSSPDGYMIHIGSPSSGIKNDVLTLGLANFLPINGVKIKNNFLFNRSDWLMPGGMKKAIVVDGYMTTGVVIEDNFITDFKGTSAGSEGIWLKGCQMPRIINNTILASRRPLHLYDCVNPTITGNYLQTGRAITQSYNAEDECLRIDGCCTPLAGTWPILNAPIPTTAVGLISAATTITNNVFDMFNIVNWYFPTPISTLMSCEMVHITNKVPAFGKISDNVFMVQADPIALYAALKVEANNYTITDNILYASAGPWYKDPIYSLPAPYFGMIFGTAPFTITGSQCFVAHNNVECCWILGPTSRVSVTSSDSVDSMNRGGTYYITVPATYARESRDSAGNSSWSIPFTLSLHPAWFETTDTSYVLSNSEIDWKFGTDFVPQGAIIEQVSVLYTISPGTTSNLVIGWAVDSGFPSTPAYISVPANPASVGTDQTHSMIPASTLRMKYGDIHRIYVLVGGSAPYTIRIQQMQVKYTL